MKRLRCLTSLLAVFFMFALPGAASADDGVITNKNMSRTIQLPTFDQDAVNEAVPEAEHAFTDMMGFYVPMQAASGATGDALPEADKADPRIYLNIDEEEVETLEVAKPLVNVFIYGPAFGVDGTAFAHRWFDTYAAVSLDDGMTWKKTNLSESADQSSFNLETDHIKAKQETMPNDHNILLGSKNNGAFHATGYERPYTAHCTECHGPALTGTTQAPSCYSCHGSRWKEEPPDKVGPLIYSAVYKNGKLVGSGENADPQSEVTIVNGNTGDELFTVDAVLNGDFFFNEKSKKPPCTVAAISGDEQGPALTVTDKDGVPVENCIGFPVELTDYPGGTYNVFHATAGNKTLVAWPSRFCGMGQPAYSMTTDAGLEDEVQQARLLAITKFIRNGDTELGVPALTGFTSPADDTVDDLYLVDAFGVAGSQGSIDFSDEGYPQAGVVPFGCVWTARGVLLPGDDLRTEENVEASHMVWTKAERLTSGRRDPNRIEVKAVKDAGFVITWQEDPDGLRPGQGLGPGEGWSGAVAHSQTDAWYSFINWEYFDIVEFDDDGDPDTVATPINILDHNLDPATEGSGRPQVFVPMAVPMRLSNNAKCNPLDTVTSGGGTPPIYCVYESTDEIPMGASDFYLKDQCADTVIVLSGNESENSDGGPGLTETEICVADTDGDGTADLPNRANTALTRPRTSLQGYNPTPEDKSAWVIVAAEESKGLGKYFFYPDGGLGSDGEIDGSADPCEESLDDPKCTAEIGKNQWYFSFDMGTPDTSAGSGNPNSLVNNLVSQGNMLNQAEVYWETGELYGLMSTLDMEDYGDYNFDIVNTEIARRASILVQSIAKADASASGVTAITSWKQGPMRQGGPADTMFRRFVLPDTFDATTDNPYAFANMDCLEFLIEPGVNPYYPGGVCADPATNLSGVVPDTCMDDDSGAVMDCPKVDFTVGSYGVGDTNPILQGYIKSGGDDGGGDPDESSGNKTRVLTWHQCPSAGVQTVGDFTAVTCDTDERTDEFVNLRDQSWYNPLDVSKGHRGFIDGDFVMFLYAWSPNWRLNAKGKDRYELYVRRSFDGGVTWGTTPGSFPASDGETYTGDGTVTCESYRKIETGLGDPIEPRICYEFGAGVAEHARNITQHKSMRITTLDPRYAASKATITDGCTDGLFLDDTLLTDLWTCDDMSEYYDSDLRNPSRYFMVFETGDNTTVEVGEAEPLDLFQGRAESFGDDYVVWTETDTGYDDPATMCYPTVPYDVLDTADIRIGSGFCNEFDNMNTRGDTHSSEANLEANPDGSKMYGAWTQWIFAEDEEEIEESDAQARRVWWIDEYRSDSEDLIYTLPGTNGGTE